MGRPKKYATHEDRLAARRARSEAERRAAGIGPKTRLPEEERIAADLESKRKYRAANKERINENARRSRAAQRAQGRNLHSEYLANMTPERRVQFEETRRKYREKNKTAIAAGQRKAYMKRPEYYVWSTIKTRAKKAGVPFNIEVTDIVIPEFCPVLGIKLERFPGRKMRDQAPSVDRLIPKLGYVKGNIEVISFRANRIKNDSTLDELLKVASYFEKKFRESDNKICVVPE